MKSIQAAAMLSLGTILAAAPPARKVLTSDTLWDWRTTGDPQISPDGKSVVYTLGWSDRMTDGMYSNLWIASIDGKDSRPLTQGKSKETSPRWSADGKRLAYLSDRSGKVQIWVRWMDAGQEARITDVQQAPSGIAWSPDGQSIAYAARVPARPSWRVETPGPGAVANGAPRRFGVRRWRGRVAGGGLIPPAVGNIAV